MTMFFQMAHQRIRSHREVVAEEGWKTLISDIDEMLNHALHFAPRHLFPRLDLRRLTVIRRKLEELVVAWRDHFDREVPSHHWRMTVLALYDRGLKLHRDALATMRRGNPVYNLQQDK